jgi:hypothetical protein
MYVISLSNISIKTNFKQIARVELKCVQYSEGDYILCMTSRYFFRSLTNIRLKCFVSHSNGMMSCQSSSAENISCNVVPFFYHHSVVIPHLVSDRRHSLFSKEDVCLDKTEILLKVALDTIKLTLIINQVYLKIVHHSIKVQDKLNSIHELIIESGLCLIIFVDLHLLFFIPPATRHQGHIVLSMSVCLYVTH